MEWNDTMDDVNQPREIYTVWLNEVTHIASFHEISGYQRHDYHNHSYFMAFLHSLQERGYRFQ